MKVLNSHIYQIVSYLIEKYTQSSKLGKESRQVFSDFREWMYFELGLNE